MKKIVPIEGVSVKTYFAYKLIKAFQTVKSIWKL